MCLFGLYAGWHWKLMHRSWQDVNRYKRQAKGLIPGYRQARAHHTKVGFWFAIIAVGLLFAVLH